MRLSALAADYDGTIARNGRLNARTGEALQRWKNAQRKLILVTGRELPDLMRVCPLLGLFDRIVAENGALLYDPARKRKKILADGPPRRFVARLRERGVTPLSVGEVIVATREKCRREVEAELAAADLDWKVVLNKGSVMALPRHVDKATGLLAALGGLRLAAAAVVGVGDAENDEVFLGVCGYSAAVANALGRLKRRVDFVTRNGHGAGVAELIDRLLRLSPEEPPPRACLLRAGS